MVARSVEKTVAKSAATMAVLMEAMLADVSVE